MPPALLARGGPLHTHVFSGRRVLFHHSLSIFSSKDEEYNPSSFSLPTTPLPLFLSPLPFASFHLSSPLSLFSLICTSFLLRPAKLELLMLADCCS